MEQFKDPEVSMRNEYTLQLFDQENNLLQEVKCHNEASSYRLLNDNRNNSTFKLLSAVRLGTGTGEINADSQTSLFKQAFSGTLSYQRVNYLAEDISFKNLHYRGTVSFPATTSYVGDLTEIGLGSTLYTHALLKDSEGNPIIIKKTSANILVVTVDVFYSINLDLNQPYGFKFFRPDCSRFSGVYFSRVYGSTTNPPTPIIQSFKLSPYYISDEIDKNGYLKYPAVSSQFGGPTLSFSYSSIPGGGKGTASFSNVRWDSGVYNISFAHSIIVTGIGALPLPNHEIIPPYVYKDILVGTGDGETTTFLPYINEIMEGENTVKGYVNGEEKTCTFCNFDVRKSPLWNKAIKFNVNNTDYTISDTPAISITEGQNPSIKYAPALLSTKIIAGTGILDNYCSYIFYDENGISLDHIRIGGFAGYGTGFLTNKPVELYYSEDGINWSLAISINQSFKFFYFDLITAKYWKIYFGNWNYYFGANSNPDQEAYNWYTVSSIEQYNKCATSGDQKFEGCDPKFIVAGDSSVFDFGKCGITFEEAPPEGSTITMDAILDLPYKDKDIIMTISAEAEIPDPRLELT